MVYKYKTKEVKTVEVEVEKVIKPSEVYKDDRPKVLENSRIIAFRPPEYGERFIDYLGYNQIWTDPNTNTNEPRFILEFVSTNWWE